MTSAFSIRRTSKCHIGYMSRVHQTTMQRWRNCHLNLTGILCDNRPHFQRSRWQHTSASHFGIPVTGMNSAGSPFTCNYSAQIHKYKDERFREQRMSIPLTFLLLTQNAGKRLQMQTHTGRTGTHRVEGRGHMRTITGPQLGEMVI